MNQQASNSNIKAGIAAAGTPGNSKPLGALRFAPRLRYQLPIQQQHHLECVVQANDDGEMSAGGLRQLRDTQARSQQKQL